MNENENNKNQEAKETNQFEQQLKECQSQVAEWKDRALRTAADYENFKKRSDKEKVMWITGAQSSVLLDLISIVDDFDRAFAHTSARPEEPQSGVSKDAGFELIYKSLQKILEKYGVQEIKELTHFDPVKHEAIMQVESVDHTQGDIVQVLQKGYTFKGEVLRPAKVSISKGYLK
jgi:molecular chaperone GrpE